MKESTEYLILDTIKKHSSVMPLFRAGYSYSKVIEWVRQLEKEEKICFGEMDQRMLSDVGITRWRLIKNKKNTFTILPLHQYKCQKLEIDEIFLP